jgi:uracil-DNA glycosylase
LNSTFGINKHGLSFSVPNGVTIPPSLRNIYTELQSDLGLTPNNSGNVEHWAKQGVLLLLALEKCLQPKNPLCAENGEGWVAVKTKCLLLSMSAAF